MPNNDLTIADKILLADDLFGMPERPLTAADLKVIGEGERRRGLTVGAFMPQTEMFPTVSRHRPQVILPITLEADGTRYRLVAWKAAGRGIGVAWPDALWSVGDLSEHAAPSPEWLRSKGLKAADARNVTKALESVWERLVAKP